MAGDRLTLFVPGDPVAKARARTVRTAKGGTRSYTPTKTVRWEDWVALNAVEALDRGLIPFDGPVWMRIRVFVRRPATRPKKYLYPDKRPDLDNYIKAVLDGLQKAGVWRDDAQVVELDARKDYALGDRRPGIKIDIESVPR